MNKAILIGRLTRDIDLKYTQGGMAIGRFTLAINRKMTREKKQEAERNNQPTADFIGCIAFGKTAETLSNYVGKGNQIGIEGHIQTGSYENKEGQRVYTTDVIVDGFTFIDSKNKNGGDSEVQDESYDGFYPTDNDDIPF
ncbi:single-stranded DNA-binding protein [Peptoniphilus raoultii]|uniref:single-stranded DNA-binding protein n=1 Tax=Peptoniphilus raoultii TaxID=1776387 RepID=UPI0008D9EB39|nr:single-stranded DNA-binding protein [Peptoniphilus raoultii]